MEWPSDWNLRVRMAVVLAALVGLTVGFVYALFWTITDAIPALVGFATGEPLAVPDEFGIGAVAVMVLLALGLEFSLSERLTGDSDAVAAEELDTCENLSAMAARLAKLADVPPPTVAVRPSRTPNAYTTGVTRGRATIVVTTGLLDELDGDEIEAVLAHEIAHVKNRDAAVMTVVSLYTVVAERIIEWSRRIRSVEDDGDRPGGAVRVGPVVAFMLLELVSLPLLLAGCAMTRVLSQYREFAADRGAAAMVGSPARVASALATLDRSVRELPHVDLRERDRARMEFFVVPMADEDLDEYTGFAVAGADDGYVARAVDCWNRIERWAESLFPTHPPTEERIERLRALEDALERA